MIISLCHQIVKAASAIDAVQSSLMQLLRYLIIVSRCYVFGLKSCDVTNYPARSRGVIKMFNFISLRQWKIRNQSSIIDTSVALWPQKL